MWRWNIKCEYEDEILNTTETLLNDKKKLAPK